MKKYYSPATAGVSLLAKSPYFISFFLRWERELQRFYPDTTKYILRQDTVRLYYRIALWAANHCMMPLAVFILTLVNFTKKRWSL